MSIFFIYYCFKNTLNFLKDDVQRVNYYELLGWMRREKNLVKRMRSQELTWWTWLLPLKACWQDGLGWHLQIVSGAFPSRLSDKNGSLGLNCFCKQYALCWTTASVLEVWNFAKCQPEAADVSSPRSKLNADSLLSFPGGQQVTCVDILVAGGIQETWLSWERVLGNLSLASWHFTYLFPLVIWLFPFYCHKPKLNVQLYTEFYECF